MKLQSTQPYDDLFWSMESNKAMQAVFTVPAVGFEAVNIVFGNKTVIKFCIHKCFISKRYSNDKTKIRIVPLTAYYFLHCAFLHKAKITIFPL
ncbi:hypothetical protein C4H11_07885 [Bacteroides zoogleoformans]|uniref:Uncharacterized protein n=1 Tax=Bacteroides zoogleoformans TaxID=28119 RepID=A0ABM6T7M7_9BACE|nr:hypothetical protein C4H11_07885 [Bacteroides zoogleoformans]